MSTERRLHSLEDVAGGVALPRYARERHGVGIVHLGIGAFHRAHQAVCTDDALAAQGGDWRILGVSLRSTDVADALDPQDGLYTLLVRGPEGTSARIIGSLAGVVAAAREPGRPLAALADPGTRIVSLTVTEKAYGIDRANGGIDAAHPAIAHDLADPRAPTGAVGLLVEGLRLRRAAGVPPFTVLCCDNLPDNGGLVRAGVIDFARRTEPALAGWIGEHVAFPSTMVDRITPATTAGTLAEAERLTGCRDLAAVETEPFSQWIIEDCFPAGRPAWEAGGALFVEDVAPYERMKLRMLNGAHSLIAYAGFLAGHRYVRDAMRDPALARLLARHLAAAADTLGNVPGIDLESYARALAERFANPAIAHETYQIAMDGTEKLPQRLLLPAVEALRADRDVRPFAFAVAAWMRYCLGRTGTGEPYALRDPREEQIRAILEAAGPEAAAISGALHGLPGLFPSALASSETWRLAVEAALAAMLARGMHSAIEQEAERIPDA